MSDNTRVDLTVNRVVTLMRNFYTVKNEMTLDTEPSCHDVFDWAADELERLQEEVVELKDDVDGLETSLDWTRNELANANGLNVQMAEFFVWDEQPGTGARRMRLPPELLRGDDSNG